MRLSKRAAEARVRRAAKRLDLEVVKSRFRLGTVDNHGLFRIVDPNRNALVAGEKFDLSVNEVAEWLADEAKEQDLPALAENLRAVAKANSGSL